MDITTLLALGYIFIVGFAFLVMVFQILAFYIAGRVTGSIDDEVTSAFTLFGALLFIGMGSTLISAILSTFLSGIIPAFVSFVLYLAVIIYAIVKIYELSIGKSILFLLLSFVITVVLSGATVYLGTLAVPGLNLSDAMELRSFDDDIEAKMLETSRLAEERLELEMAEIDTEPLDEELPPVDSEEALDETAIEEEPVEEAMEEEPSEKSEAPTPSGPGLPGSTE